MKQYTDKLQTARLIELGFEKPKSISGYCQRGPYEYDAETNTKMVVYDDTQYPIYAYSIGELLSFLPEEIKVENHSEPAYLQMLYDEENVWEVGYTFYGNGMYIKRNTEFIDCLFQMCVKLKENGVI